MKKYYTEIDEIPLRNYRKALEEGKYEYCRRDIYDGDDESDKAAWALISDDYIKVFGLGEKYEQYLELQIELIELQCDFVIEDRRFLLNEIGRIEREMNKIISGDQSGTLNQAITFVMKIMKTVIDESRITAKDFFNLFESCVNEQKLMNRRYGKESHQE